MKSLRVPSWNETNRDAEWAAVDRQRRREMGNRWASDRYDDVISYPDETHPLGSNGPVTHLVKDGQPLTSRGAELLKV